MTYHASILLNQEALLAASRLAAKAKGQQAKPSLPRYLRMMLAGIGILVALVIIFLERQFPDSRPTFSGIFILLGAFLMGALGMILLLLKFSNPIHVEMHVNYEFNEDEFRIIMQDRQTHIPWISLKKVILGKKYWLIVSASANPHELGFLLEADTLTPELETFLRSKLPFEEVV